MKPLSHAPLSWTPTPLCSISGVASWPPIGVGCCFYSYYWIFSLIDTLRRLSIPSQYCLLIQNRRRSLGATSEAWVSVRISCELPSAASFLSWGYSRSRLGFIPYVVLEGQERQILASRQAKLKLMATYMYSYNFYCSQEAALICPWDGVCAAFLKIWTLIGKARYIIFSKD